MKLYVDDVRLAPEGWILARTAPEAIEILENNQVIHLSLDHDLGKEKKNGTGYDVLIWIERKAAQGVLSFIPYITIHTSNPSARKKMLQAVESIKRFV